MYKPFLTLLLGSLYEKNFTTCGSNYLLVPSHQTRLIPLFFVSEHAEEYNENVYFTLQTRSLIN